MRTSAADCHTGAGQRRDGQLRPGPGGGLTPCFPLIAHHRRCEGAGGRAFACGTRLRRRQTRQGPVFESQACRVGPDASAPVHCGSPKKERTATKEVERGQAGHRLPRRVRGLCGWALGRDARADSRQSCFSGASASRAPRRHGHLFRYTCVLSAPM